MFSNLTSALRYNLARPDPTFKVKLSSDLYKIGELRLFFLMDLAVSDIVEPCAEVSEFWAFRLEAADSDNHRIHNKVVLYNIFMVAFCFNLVRNSTKNWE